MRREVELQAQLAKMQPTLVAGEFVFCTVSPTVFERLSVQPRGCFREEEGVTLIIDRPAAEAQQLDYEFPSRMITLNVYSPLAAVGFLAAVTGLLAEAGISVNPISGYHHDHLFVPVDQAEEALRLLEEASRAAGI